MSHRKTAGRIAYRVALVGIAAATIECGKLALTFLPNIEVVTLLTALYGYVFGIYGIVASAIFVMIEPLIYGFGTWMLSYALYWPFVALVFMLLGRMKVKNRVGLTAAAVLLTAWFGVLTSLVDVGLFMGRFDNFFYRFGILYARGLGFYLIQIATNIAVFLLLFRLLAEKLQRLRLP